MDVAAEAEGCASVVFDAAVDGFGGSIAGGGVVEVGEDVLGSAFVGAAEGLELGRNGGGDHGLAVDELAQQAWLFVGMRVAVDRDEVLVGLPGFLDFRVHGVSECAF